jgi:hypothetical protein
MDVVNRGPLSNISTNIVPNAAPTVSNASKDGSSSPSDDIPEQVGRHHRQTTPPAPKRLHKRKRNHEGGAIQTVANAASSLPAITPSPRAFPLANATVAAATAAASSTPATTPAPKVQVSYSERWTPEVWAVELAKFYEALWKTPTLSFTSFCNTQMYPRRRSTFNREWNDSGLYIHLASNCPVTHPDVKRCLEQYVASRQKKKAAVPTTRNRGSDLLSEEEEKFFADTCVALAAAGNGINEDMLHTILNKYLEEAQPGAGPASIDLVRKVKKRQELATARNVYPIDPARMAQASPDVQNTFFKQVDAIIRVMHLIDPKICPWKCFADVPGAHKYNMDEIGPNPCDHRKPIIVSRAMEADFTRLFQNTREGDGRMNFHITLCVTTQAAGENCVPGKGIEGAPPMFVILSDKSATDEIDNLPAQQQKESISEQHPDDIVKLNGALMTEWFDLKNLESNTKDVNTYGFNIRATPSGSILKRNFYDYILHFIRYLPKGQGPGGLLVILFIDWHGSRVHPTALAYAHANNVLIVVLPSKSSIWSQPNDLSVNMALSFEISNAAATLGLLETETFTLQDGSKVFRQGMEKFIDKEGILLLAKGINRATRGFEKAGLHPFNYECTGWSEAIQNYGGMQNLVQEERRLNGTKIAKTSWVVVLRDETSRGELTAADKRVLLANEWPENLSTIMSPTFAAYCALKQRLHLCLQNPNRDKTLPPPPSSEAERAALKLFCYEGADKRATTASSATEGEIAHQRSMTWLRSTANNNSIQVKKKFGLPEHEYAAIKMGADKFCVCDNGVMIHMSADELLDSYLVQNPIIVLDTKEEQKQRNKVRKRRKEEVQQLEKMAKGIAMRHRQALIDSTCRELLSQYRNSDGCPPDDGVMREIQKTIEATYEETIDIDTHGQPHLTNVVLKGFSGHSSATTATNAVLSILANKKGSKKAKLARKTVVSTKRGADGACIAIALHRSIQEGKLEGQVKNIEKLKKEVTSLVTSLDLLAKHIRNHPDGYWKVYASSDKSTSAGKVLDSICKLFDIKTPQGHKKSVDHLRMGLESVNASKEYFDQKVEALKSESTTKKTELEEAEATVTAITSNLPQAGPDADDEDDGASHATL